MPKGTIASVLREAGLGGGYGAFIPDLPGCVAVGQRLPTVRRGIRWAVAVHIEDMISRGQRLPEPRAEADMLEAEVA
jgi:predicted RNase H-like HicB family nuclease